MVATKEKVSITLDQELLAEAREHAGANLSGWVASAVHDRLLLERGRKLMREREAERGPLSPELLEQIRAEWLG